MADNPFYPGYNPANDRGGYYPGKGMPRLPQSYVPRFSTGYWQDYEAMNVLFEDIDNAGQQTIDNVGNLPKWVWERTLDDMNTAFNVAVYPSEVDPITMDEYDVSAAPGAMGMQININPVKWYKDPGKELGNFAKKSVSIIFDPEDFSRRAEDEFWRRATAADPYERSGILEKIDRRLMGLYSDEASRYGLGGKTNPIALEGLNVRRTIKAEYADVTDAAGNVTRTLQVAPGIGGWTGSKHTNGRISKITPLDEKDPEGEVVVETSIDHGEHLREKFQLFERNAETVPFRANHYHNFLDANIDFVTADLNNLYQRAQRGEATLVAGDAEYIQGWGALAHYTNKLGEVGTGGRISKGLTYYVERDGKIVTDTDAGFTGYTNILKTLDKERTPSSTIGRVEFDFINDAGEKEEIVQVQLGALGWKPPSAPQPAGTGKPTAAPGAGATTVVTKTVEATEGAKLLPGGDVLLSYNRATKEFSGQLVALSRGIEENRQLLRETRKSLVDTNQTELLKICDECTANFDRLAGELEKRIGIFDENGRGTISAPLQRLLDNPNETFAERLQYRRYVQNLRYDLETYMGEVSKAIGEKGILGWNTMHESVHGKLQRAMGHRALADDDSRIVRILRDEDEGGAKRNYNLESRVGVFYARVGARKEGLERGREIWNAWKKGNLPETYGWTQGMKGLFLAGSWAFNPDAMIKYALGKVHNFGLMASDEKDFDKVMDGKFISSIGLNKAFRNSFKLELEVGGQKWKTQALYGGKHFDGVKNLRAWSKMENVGEYMKDIGGGKFVTAKFSGKDMLRMLFPDDPNASPVNIVFTGKDGKLALNKVFLNKFFPGGLPADPKDLEDALKDIKKMQDQAIAFRDWVKNNAARMGIKNLDFDMYIQLLEKLNKQTQFLNITRKYAGVLEKFVAFGNKLQDTIFTKLGISKLVQRAGLQQYAIKKALQEVIVKSTSKIVAKLGLQTLSQAIGSAAPGIGNAVAVVAAAIADKIVDTAVETFKKTVGQAWDLIVKGEVRDVWADIDKRMIKLIKIAVILIIIVMILFTIIFGRFGGIIGGDFLFGPNGIGVFTGSATMHTQYNLASNPYIVILSTFSDIDPTRQYSNMEQTQFNWDLWPPPADVALPRLPGVIVPPGDVPQPGEGRLWCFADGVPTHWSELPQVALPSNVTQTGNSLVREGWRLTNNLHQGFWCWHNFSPPPVTPFPPAGYCNWQDGQTPRCGGSPWIFYWEVFQSNPDHCYGSTGICGPNDNVDALRNDNSLFWCTQLGVKAYANAGDGIQFSNASNSHLQEMFYNSVYDQESGTRRLVGGRNIDLDFLAPGDLMFIDATPVSNLSSFRTVSHVAMIHSIQNDGVWSLESNSPRRSYFYPYVYDNSGSYLMLRSPNTGAGWYVQIVGLSTTGDLER